MTDNRVTLSPRETALLSAWERERKRYVALDELRRILGPASARKFVTGLARKRLLERVAPGVYLIHPFRSLARSRGFSSPVAAAAILANEPYYLGGWWAFSLHRLTQQMYASILDAYVTRERRARQLGAARLVFHVLPPSAFEYGIEPVSLEGVEVQASDAERTVLDALDYPRTFGGIREALHLITPALSRVDLDQLVAYAAQRSRPSTCQRLGVLLQRRGAEAHVLAPLARRLHETTTLLSMIPDDPRTGPVNAAWRVIENDAGDRRSDEDEDQDDEDSEREGDRDRDERA